MNVESKRGMYFAINLNPQGSNVIFGVIIYQYLLE